MDSAVLLNVSEDGIGICPFVLLRAAMEFEGFDDGVLRELIEDSFGCASIGAGWRLELEVIEYEGGHLLRGARIDFSLVPILFGHFLDLVVGPVYLFLQPALLSLDSEAGYHNPVVLDVPQEL
jgi:hypothetical protein